MAKKHAEAETAIRERQSVREKVKSNLPTAAKVAAIVGVIALAYSGVGLDQNAFAHELTHDIRHALGFACHEIFFSLRISDEISFLCHYQG